ncbi:MAG: M48 family metallopeptidase [Verrucomicrobiota bacterium]|nr:M48 family metallopeptidase [Verrucomicrobiota bacterium]
MSESSYLATAFQGKKTLQGSLRFEGETLHFVSNDGSHEMPLGGMRTRVGGYNDEQIFFEHPSHPEFSVYTRDKRVVEDECLARFPDLVAQLRGGQKRKVSYRKPLILLGGIVLFFVMLLLLLVMQKDRIVEIIVDRIPLEWEVKLGEQLFKAVAADGGLVSDPEQQTYLESVTGPLLRGVDTKGFTVRFHIKTDTNVNAFAMPGGNVVVFTGLLERVSRKEELAGVLAHEIAHVTRRHGFRKLVESAGMLLLVQAIVGNPEGIMAIITSNSQRLLSQKFSRDFEREADDEGWEFMVAANIDPRGMVDFFKKLQQLEGNGSGRTFELLLTHPTTEERIARLEKRWEKMENKTFPPLGPSKRE